MKQNIALAFLFSMINVAFSQSATEILRRSYQKCQSVVNGHYVMTSHMKYMSRTDTIARTYDCYFSKTGNDTILPVLFYYDLSVLDTIRSRQLYTGNELISMYERDSSAIIKSVQLWAPDIEEDEPDDELYSPLTSRKGAPLLTEMDEPGHEIELIGQEIVNGRDCHHVRVINFPENEPDDMIKITRSAVDFWINTSDDIPVQYSITLDLVVGPDSMVQYELIELNSYELNGISDKSIFSTASIPGYYKIRDYVPSETPNPLPPGSETPDWTLPSPDGQQISLRSLRGQLVLIDFFYKSCYPCLLALPTLQSLHEKYHENGLRVIGIDPYDKPEEGIAEFMARRGITYPVVLCDKDIPDAYNVSGYPTIYLIDKDGTVLHAQAGYGPDTEKELESIIRRALRLEPILDKVDKAINK